MTDHITAREVGAMLRKTDSLYEQYIAEHPSNSCPKSRQIIVYKELWIWQNIDEYADYDKTVENLCNDLHISERTARRAISCLRARGLLFFETIGSVLDNVLVLTP